MHTLSLTSATKTLGSGDLLPLSQYVIELVYGDLEYVRSVLGTTDITREELDQYYKRAKDSWHIVEIDVKNRNEHTAWFRSVGIKGLDFYHPLGYKNIWFRNAEDAFTFRLRFGL